jgi:hypothetical protein
MAAFLSLDTLSGLSSIFIFLFIWVLVYGVLSVVKPFGDKKEGLYAIIALAMGLIVGMNSGAIKVFTFFTSWFSVLLILLFFILLAVMLFGVKMETISKFIEKGSSDGGQGKQVIVWIVIISLVIMGIGIALNVGDTLLSKQPNQAGVNTQQQPSQGTIQVIDPETGMASQYDYDYRYDRGLQDTGTQQVTTTTSGGATDTGDFQTNFVKTIFHPKVLGLTLFLLIGLFASLWLTESVPYK